MRWLCSWLRTASWLGLKGLEGRDGHHTPSLGRVDTADQCVSGKEGDEDNCYLRIVGRMMIRRLISPSWTAPWLPGDTLG